MITRYCGVYWIARKDERPDDGTVCVFHRKGNKPDNIRYGYYAFGYFREKVGDQFKAIDSKVIDYWMPIPVFPDEEMKCENHREKNR